MALVVVCCIGVSGAQQGTISATDAQQRHVTPCWQRQQRQQWQQHPPSCPPAPGA